MKISVGKPDPNAQIPNLDAPRSAGTDQQDAQLAPDYYDVSTNLQTLQMFAKCIAFVHDSAGLFRHSKLS